MHKRKVVHVSSFLRPPGDGVLPQFCPPCPPALPDTSEGRLRKVLAPLPTPPAGEGEEEREGSKSNSPSPRQSVCGLDSRGDTAVEETVLKILVIGDSTVGKTSYVQGFVQNKFLDCYKNTVGVDFSSKLLSHKKYGGRPVKLQIWDIAGQDRYVCLTRVYYQHADGCIVMFDLTNRKSFASVGLWKRDLDSKCVLDNGTRLPCLLLASKCDLPGRQVEMNEIEAVCRTFDFMSWIEVSSKEHLMIEDSMNFLVDRIICAKRLDRVLVRPGICLTKEREERPEKDRVPAYCWC